MRWFYNKGISLIAVGRRGGYLYPDGGERFDGEKACAHVLAQMADGVLQPGKLITHRLHYTRMEEAYEMAYRRDKEMLGVVFEWKE